jgi:hypothetical protein
MGCDFDILIQVLHRSCWITIVNLGTKTSCGGFPLCNATRKLFQTKGFCGDYGAQFPILDSKINAEDIILSQQLSKKTVEVQIEAVETLSDETIEQKNEDANEEDEGEKEEEEEEEDRQNCFLYYSRDQFEELIKLIDPLENDAHNFRLYNKIMEPVPMWCEMALTALPYSDPSGWRGQIWMSPNKDQIDQTTSCLREKQKELLSLYKKSLSQTISKLPFELDDIIAEYALPVGSDVRVAWCDDEGQAQALRQGDVSEPKCCIM